MASMISWRTGSAGVMRSPTAATREGIAASRLRHRKLRQRRDHVALYRLPHALPQGGGRAQKLVAFQFFILAPYVAVEAIRALVNGSHAEESMVGIALAASSVVFMPLLGRAKQRFGSRIGSSATASEGKQNLLCAYLAAALLVGLLGNALFGAWWLDPVVALFIAYVAVQEGREAWRGDACC
jgi:Cation efflux family